MIAYHCISQSCYLISETSPSALGLITCRELFIGGKARFINVPIDTDDPGLLARRTSTRGWA